MRYTIAEEELGFFLGSYEKYGVFAKTDVFGISKAFSFDTKKEAEEFLLEFLNAETKKWKILEVDAPDKYVNVVDLIKSGYDKYTHKMMDNLEVPSDAIH